MTDNEIIKALECCTTKGAKCSDCPAFKKVDRSDCKKYFRGAIDIINRQQEEIDVLNNNLSAMVVTMRNSAKATRNEAIKGLVDRLNDRIINFPSVYPVENATLAFLNGSSHRQLEILEIIDNLVKEYEKGR